MTDLEGNTEFCFLRISKCPNMNSLFPLELVRFVTLRNKWVKLVEKGPEIPSKTPGHLQLHCLIMCNSNQHFLGNDELFHV